TDKQVELVSNFAAQAVIAIENTRLLNELRQRTDDLSKALEQQTATSEVLRVISSSPAELKPLFEAILENATRLCRATYGTLWLSEQDGFRKVAVYGARPTDGLPPIGTLFHPGPETTPGRAAGTAQPAQSADLRESRGYRERDPLTVAAVD